MEDSALLIILESLYFQERSAWQMEVPEGETKVSSRQSDWVVDTCLFEMKQSLI